MKKVISILIVLAMVLSMCACGGSSASSAASAAKSEAAAAVSEAKSEAAAAVSEAKSEAAAAVSEAKSEAAEAVSEAVSEAPAADEDFGEPVTWIMGHGFPENNNTKTAIWRELSDKLYELSGGTFTIEQAYDGTICGDAEILDSILTDVTQFGPLPDSYATGYIPELAVLCIPGWFAGTPEDYVAFEDEIRPIMEEIFAKYDLKYISGDYPGQSSLFGNGDPILTPDDVVGKLIRVSGTDQINAVEAWGGAATIIPLPDLTTALDRGTVDSAFSGYQLIHVFSFDEIVDYAVILPTLEPAHCFFCTMDNWNALSEKQQEALLEAWKDVTPITFDRSAELEYGPYLQEFRDAGVNVIEMSLDEFEVFADMLKPNFDALKEGNSDLGLELMKVVYKYHGWDWED